MRTSILTVALGIFQLALSIEKSFLSFSSFPSEPTVTFIASLMAVCAVMDVVEFLRKS